MFSKGRWIALAAVCALAGCNTANTHIGDADPVIGEAVKYNAALQTINPDPVYAEGTALPGDNGAAGAAAVKRYRTGENKTQHKAEANTSKSSGLSTTQSTGSSGGGGPH
jgi:hypothetical protein